MDRVQSYTVLLLSAPSKKLLEPHTPSSLSLHKTRAFSSVPWFNSSVFLCFDLCSSHWCCKPNQSCTISSTCTILLPSQLTSGLQCQAQTSSHSCSRAQQWLLPPSLSLGAVSGCCLGRLVQQPHSPRVPGYREALPSTKC